MFNSKKISTRHLYDGIGEVLSNVSCCGLEANNRSDQLVQTDITVTLGCHTPISFADLQLGECAVDLGCGAGGDLLRAAEAVGEQGCVIGIDQSESMVEVAKQRIRKVGNKCAKVRLGSIESLPVEDAFADVVFSNCVVNLSENKTAVFDEIARVLKPGGRMVLGDTIKTKDLPPTMADDHSLWACCIAGAMTVEEVTDQLNRIGFVNVEFLDPQPDLPALKAAGKISGYAPADLTGYVASVIIRARKPR